MWIFGIADNLVIFMSFAGKNNDVAWLSLLHSMADSLFSVADASKIALRHTGFQVAQNAVICLIARIVCRQDDIIGNRCFFSHNRTFCLIPVASGSDQEDDAVLFEVLNSINRFFDGIRCMRIINED